MIVKRAALSGILLLWYLPAMAQFSGYSSVTFGYHKNPLYNYANISDQLKMAYLELAFQPENKMAPFDLRYVGGLTTFNRLTDRDYYEHGLTGFISLQLAGAVEDSSEDEEEADEAPERPPSYADSTSQLLSVGARISARYDRSAHRDFDNRGAELHLAYRATTGDRTFVRFRNDFMYHAYPYVIDLSNWNNVLSAEFSLWTDGGVLCGMTASTGVKYYTTSSFDTTRFESTTGGTPGKGKGGGNQVGTTTEETLIQPQINGTIQLSAGLFLRKDWSSQASLSAIALYRLTPRYAERYLAPLTPEASLTEDLYTDFFSHKGPEVRVRITQPVGGKIQAIIGVEFLRKTYGIPALDLDGIEIDPTRTDLRSTLEIYLSRYFEITDGLGADLAVGIEFARNQSNDRYNDFSTSSISLGVGIGF